MPNSRLHLFYLIEQKEGEGDSVKHGRRKPALGVPDFISSPIRRLPPREAAGFPLCQTGA
jgi:hypothetical protein